MGFLPRRIEPAPPTHGTSSTTPGLHTSLPGRAESSPESLSSKPSRPQSALSSKVHIPELSPATAALVARIVGKGTGEPKRHDTRFIAWNPPQFHQGRNYRRAQQTDTMKTSSTIIELPTPPFVHSNRVSTPAVPQQATTATTTSTLSQGSHAKPSSLVTIAPKPAEAPSVAAPALPQPPSIQYPPQPQAIAPAAKDSPPSAKRKRAAVAARQRRSTNGPKRKRRRRGNDSDSEDIIRAEDSSSDESDVAPTATQTKSGRQVNRPSLYVPSCASPAVAKESSNSLDVSDNTHRPAAAAQKRKRVYRKGKDGIVSCIHCQRGHSPLSNAIVICGECNGPWHQLCHDPPVESEIVTVKERRWVCRECKPVPITVLQPTVVRSNPSLTGPSLGPPVHAPLMMPKIEVGGEGFSADERRGFLSGLSHTALVELLVTLSDQHPTVAMFPGNLKALQSKFVFKPNKFTAPTPSSTSANTPTIANAINSALTNSGDIALQQTHLTPDFLPTPPAQQTQHEDLGEESEYEFDDHRLYPRAGNGFRFSTNAEDMDIMLDDPSCRTFSYGLHGPAQIRAQAHEVAPVWGS
ncbi:hypothetical protein BBP40_005912 [Aspergillus hancockii]|nr:hypothetical protein BBP40_005912 [Aspergillus hancockii]